jgi:uncharacterized OB-fold protein
MNGTSDHSKKKEPFRKGLFNLEGQEAHLIGIQCGRCHISFFPKREFCSNCFQSDRMKEVNLSKMGTLYTYTTVFQGKPNFNAPYSLGFVDLKEGVRIFAPLLDVAPEDLRIGMEMELVFRPMDWVSGQEEAWVYGFKPYEGKNTLNE